MTIIFLSKRKIKDIRYKYGKSAVEHFLKFPFCQNCLDERLITLNIHHVLGKNHEVYKTLCFNCHMIEHNREYANETLASCQKKQSEKLNKNKQQGEEKDTGILALLNKGIPIRRIVKLSKTTTQRISKVMKINGFVSRPRSGYHKI